MTVGEYASKFHKFMKYWPYYQNGNNGEDLCAQFENGLRADIRTIVSVFQLINLSTLVSKCRIYEASLKGKHIDTKIHRATKT
uniref:Retrotransposon gag domain-containing protein n=1 Tax=Cajanus cajan TaxID=3821 RepID=A0A151TWY3_CAJCA|nr:hypothetical protein KK1_010842 [Cajanus cajan]